MATVNHPRLPHVAVEIPEGDVGAWVAQGWVSDEPEPEPDEDENDLDDLDD